MPEIRELLSEWTTPGDIESRHEAEILLARALDTERAWLFAHADHVPDAQAETRFRALMEARRRGEPIAYLLGQRGFWTLDLKVSRDVLIPRAETELLVELALERIPLDASFSVADLGTGSGAVALAIASERPATRVLATDRSLAALEVARSNAADLGIDNVEFAQGDWCAALGGRVFDLIVSNPPYIAADDVHLSLGDLRFEPASALASGADGLDAIRAIIADAPAHLSPGGWLLVEHGYAQASAVASILEEAGFMHVRCWPDLAGRDRISGACWAPLRPG
ncbi:peptide chain release factor N(5)-glutamine methyltransferase [Dokdonella immobilis]|uniref:Release factor glutamine methyltransferase n=1 Tax=Dokdonella immobilis TaxID=578942 RepID=A0A1I4Z4P9_9GAMM|nr:peptide chain release factor N(5)-glutamine methyltransferase [Dokdonella immobilis]SFN44949.1 [protein release factor]-glutamine N5-methyltransferase [Dokdonella immobilis]